jgi:hypothetical protein
MPSLPHHVKGARLPQAPHSAPPPQVKVPPLAQPTAKHQLVVLDIGDSLGEDLGFGLGDQFGGDPWVTLHQEAKVDTGLDAPNDYDWPTNLEKFLQEFHPKVVIVMLGGNDTNDIEQYNKLAGFGTALWQVDYGQRVEQIMDEATSAGARVFWVGMPIMQDPALSQKMLQLNAVYAHVASITPGVTYFSSWNIFAVHGQYNEYIPGPNGSTIDARYGDGVHIAPGGYDWLTQKMVPVMERTWHIKLDPSW